MILVLFFAALLAFAALVHRREQRKQWIHIPQPSRAPEEPRPQHVDYDPDDPNDPYNYSGPLTGF
ncbi:hypothetical protein [Micromonospora sp. B11E3]|uniref:hypothetical protein n=1 Tax=Micromonospora sp. B11E3 TaxID=3153562 RepID=UPI00325FA30C